MSRILHDALSRRDLLGLAVRVALGASAVLVAGAGCTKTSAQTCSDPGKLTDAELELRRSLAYTEASGSEKQVCGGCAFFSPSAAGPCGACSIMNGPVNSRGHCTSWAAASP